MKELITTVTSDGSMPQEAFDADELVGMGILTFADGEEIVGFAEISLSDNKMRFTPNESMPLSAPNSPLSLFSSRKASTLKLKMRQPALDLHFRFEGAWVYRSYSLKMLSIDPFEFIFSRAVYGPSDPPDTFDRATFNFADSNNLIGGERFKFSNHGIDTVSFKRPADTRATGYSKKLAMKINLHSRSAFGSDMRKPLPDLNRQSYAIAQFDEPIRVVDALNRVRSFITFASILRGAETNVTSMSLRCGEGHGFALRQSWTKPVIEDNDLGELSQNRGVLSDSIEYFERFSEFHDVNDAFDTLATVSPLGENMGWAFVALISTAEGLVGMFEKRKYLRVWDDERGKKRDLHLSEKLQLIRDQVQPYFIDSLSDQWTKDVVNHRNAQMHEAMSPFRLTDAEVVFTRNLALRTMLRAYALHKCGLPERAILKALNGPRPSGSFFDLRPKREQQPLPPEAFS